MNNLNRKEEIVLVVESVLKIARETYNLPQDEVYISFLPSSRINAVATSSIVFGKGIDNRKYNININTEYLYTVSDFDLHYQTVACHEVAHIVQFMLGKEGSHNEEFTTIFNTLKEKLNEENI